MLYCSELDAVCEHREPLNVQGGICVTQSIKMSLNLVSLTCVIRAMEMCPLYTKHYIGLMLHLNLTKTSQLQEQRVRHSAWLITVQG